MASCTRRELIEGAIGVSTIALAGFARAVAGHNTPQSLDFARP
jgi:hypothetical protein